MRPCRLLSLVLPALLAPGLVGCSGSPEPGASRQTQASASIRASSGTPTSSSTSTSTTPTSAPTTSAVDCTKVSCVALTFDDGPSPETTPTLLDTLEREHVTATMFLIGRNVTAHPEIARRERDLGLEIGNHTQTHVTLSEASSAVVRRELEQANAAITRATGVTPTVMRPPYAARTSRTDAEAGRQGLAVIVWDWSPQDWVVKDRASVVSRTLSGTRPGSILLFHDIHPWTVQAIPEIIRGLRAKGYHFVTVTQLLGQTRPGKVYP